MRAYRVLIFIFSFLPIIGHAQADQDSLGLSDLIEIALTKNYNVRIAKIQAEIAENNTAPGAAGLVPEVGLEGGANVSSNNTNITFASPQQPEINATNARTQIYNGALVLNYTLFSGGENRLFLRQLKEGSYQQNLRMRAAMEGTILSLLQDFLAYNLQKKALELEEEALQISKDRMNRAQSNYEFGAFSRLEVLNAEVDLRKDSIAWMQTKVELRKAYRQLLARLEIPVDTNIVIDTKYSLNTGLELSEVETTAFQKNADFLLSQSIVRTQELQLRIAKSRWMPQLNLSAAYQYNFQDNEAGFIATQENYGLNAGINLRYPLFQGGNRRRDQQNQSLLLEAEELRRNDAERELKRNLMDAYEEYESNIDLMQMSDRNILAAKLNYDRSIEAFNNGQLDGIQLREAQLNYLNSLYFYEQQKVLVKLTETRLRYLSGTIVN